MDGYIKEQEKILNLSSIVPKGIYLIIFEFQLYVEIWNKSLSNSAVNIIENGSIAEIKKSSAANLTFYGDQVVKYGDEFEWNLKLIDGDNVNIVVGLILNKTYVLERYLSSFGWYKENGYAYGTKSRYFAYYGGSRTHSHPYAPENALFVEKGDTMKIKFVWKETECSLNYIINGIDAGNAISTDESKRGLNNKTNEYRLAVHLLSNSVKIKVEWIVGHKCVWYSIVISISLSTLKIEMNRSQ